MATEQQDQPNELAIAETEAQVASLGDVMTTQQLQAGIKQATKQRELIKEYVNSHLVENVDYGVIQDKDKGFKSKPTLYKPGQEKIFSLMNLTSRLEKDTDTIEMIGEKGLVAYLCRVYRKGEEIAQGRGAAKIGDKKRDANATIKIAEKRARMDACLSLGFSESFTQDMEDPDYRDNNSSAEPVAPKAASPKQKDYVKNLAKDFLAGVPGVSVGYLKRFYEANGVKDALNMTSEEASAFIEAGKMGKLVLPPDEPPIDPPAPDTTNQEPIEGEVLDTPDQITIDEDFKVMVEAKFKELGKSIKDQMRIYRNLTGHPHPPKLEDTKAWLLVDDYLNKLAEGAEDNVGI